MTNPQTVIVTWLMGVLVAQFQRLGIDPAELGSSLWTSTGARAAPRGICIWCRWGACGSATSASEATRNWACGSVPGCPCRP